MDVFFPVKYSHPVKVEDAWLFDFVFFELLLLLVVPIGTLVFNIEGIIQIKGSEDIWYGKRKQ